MYRKIIAKIAALSAGAQLKNFLEATKHIKETQNNLLRRQLKIIANSEFARKYNLQHVDTYNDYRKRLSVQKYEDILPYIENLKRGNFSALLNPSRKLLMFALTSGTTAQPKYIPVTKTFVNDYRRGWNIFGLKALLEHPDAFMKKIIQITSSAREIKTPSGLWAGAITGLLAQTQKWIVRKYYITPICASEIKDPIAKMYTIARLALPETIGFISTANPSTTLRFAKTIEQYSQDLIRDIHDGKLTPPNEIDKNISDELNAAKFLKPNPIRAKQLEKILERDGKLIPKNCMNISFIANWMGGTLKLYLKRFDEYFGNIPVRDIGLLASEGRFSIPIEDNTPAGILEITSNFFEFIPEQEYDKKNPDIILPEQLKIGEKYFLIFSNATGLCRYDIGDLIRVVDFYNQTPVIEFLNKGSHISSVTGEKITERQVVEAIEILSAKLSIKIENFTLQPKWNDPPYYVLTLEQSDVDNHQSQIADIFDDILKNINIEYQSKRNTHRLGPIKINIVPDGYFGNEDIRKLTSMGRSEQYKRKFLLPLSHD